MLHDERPSGELWCPTEGADTRAVRHEIDMTPADWAALSRLASGDWVSDAHIDRLQSLGLV